MFGNACTAVQRTISIFFLNEYKPYIFSGFMTTGSGIPFYCKQIKSTAVFHICILQINNVIIRIIGYAAVIIFSQYKLLILPLQFWMNTKKMIHFSLQKRNGIQPFVNI